MARILIVDDSAMSRRILKRILESAGHQITEAEEGMGAIERYFLEKPDVVMLDLVLKGITGLEVLEKIREMDRAARIVVASADIQKSTKELTERAGAVGFVTKPFNETDLLDTVQTALSEV
jgi:two-component system chemotaxis response regulator CheY